MAKIFSYVGYLIAFVVILITLYLLNKGNVPPNFDFEMMVWIPLAIVFGLYTNSPYLFLTYLIHKHAKYTKKLIFEILILCFISFVGIKDLMMMRSDHDAQSGIALLFITPKQWLIVVISILLLTIFNKSLDEK